MKKQYLTHYTIFFQFGLSFFHFHENNSEKSDSADFSAYVFYFNFMGSIA
jgi:hypothetical protein